MCVYAHGVNVCGLFIYLFPFFFFFVPVNDVWGEGKSEEKKLKQFRRTYTDKPLSPPFRNGPTVQHPTGPVSLDRLRSLVVFGFLTVPSGSDSC